MGIANGLGNDDRSTIAGNMLEDTPLRDLRSQSLLPCD